MRTRLFTVALVLALSTTLPAPTLAAAGTRLAVPETLVAPTAEIEFVLVCTFDALGQQSCFWEGVAVGVAFTAFLAADAAVIVACGGTIVTGGALAPGCVGAIVAADLAGTALAVAGLIYDECANGMVAPMALEEEF